ncbi:MAG: thiosulfate sulfurtransferase [Leptospiraceae bacterium]|nr:thiosulfate sulfurtransferase [Leptospiraceae bacterium]MCK6381025.1 thiosulfate sulfurtransferase [Leptospiraceae bacterium]NUM41435.1 thiosulfate sulfurtransferase [Leptospiraceae bacterium]
MSDWNFLKPEIESSDFIIDCRSLQAYEEETIKGAYHFPFIKKAFGSDPESQKKIFCPLKYILNLVSEEKKTRIIVFDEGMGMHAARMVLFLRGVGFKETYILAKKWPVAGVKEKGTKIIDPEVNEKAKTIQGVVDKSFMEKNLTKLQIFDTRTQAEYEGQIPRLVSPEQGTLCGRLPGSFLWDWTSLYDSEGMVIDKFTFNKRLLGFPFMPERTTVIYDYNGARSCLIALMLKECGYQDVHTYQGSWFEWRKSSLPKQAVSIYKTENKEVTLPRVGGIARGK